MLAFGALAFQEFIVREPLPLATVHQAVLDFLAGREDAVLFGAQAVNAYVGEPRMTQDIDLLSPRAKDLAEELREHLAKEFGIAVRVRTIGEGRGFRLFQMRKDGNRHLVDLRSVETLPNSQRIAQILVLSPPDLIASKVIAYHQRRGSPKSGTDWRDLAMLLLAFPDLKHDRGPVRDALQESGCGPEVMEAWCHLAQQEIKRQHDDDDY